MCVQIEQSAYLLWKKKVAKVDSGKMRGILEESRRGEEGSGKRGVTSASDVKKLPLSSSLSVCPTICLLTCTCPSSVRKKERNKVYMSKGLFGFCGVLAFSVFPLYLGEDPISSLDDSSLLQVPHHQIPIPSHFIHVPCTVPSNINKLTKQHPKLVWHIYCGLFCPSSSPSLSPHFLSDTLSLLSILLAQIHTSHTHKRHRSRRIGTHTAHRPHTQVKQTTARRRRGEREENGCHHVPNSTDQDAGDARCR